MRREFWNKALNVLAGVLIVAGLLLLFGAAGESDMYEGVGEYLPLMVTVKKVAIGMSMFVIGVVVLNHNKEEK